MQVRDAEPLARGHADDRGALKRGNDLIHAREVRGNPHRKLVGADVRPRLRGALGVFRKAGEVKTGNSKASIVAAIKEHRQVLEVNAHTNYRMRRRRIVKEAITHGKPLGHHAHALAIAATPIEIAAEVHGTVLAGKPNARAHKSSLRRIYMEFYPNTPSPKRTTSL